MTEPLVIDVHGLNKSYGGRKVVDDVSIQLAEGRICGFLGPNGSGKTTTLRMLCGLLTPDSGSGTCLGLDIINEAGAIKRATGYMTQKFSLYEDLTLEENLMFSARVHELDHRQNRVDRALENLGLTGRRRQLAGTLSGGWKQRLALASATLHEPKLLLLDEPTAGVDPKARRTFWDEIHALARAGLTVLVSTHYMDEAERCHEIAYISYGKLIARGTADELIDRSHLITFNLEGGDIDLVADQLRKQPGVEMAAPFGASLHVSGSDRAALETALKTIKAEALTITEVRPSLEDIFIQLMDRSEDNFQ